MIDIEKIEGTPFHIAQDENGVIVALGKYRLSDILESKEEALSLIYEKNWMLIMNLIALVANLETTEIINQQNKN